MAKNAVSVPRHLLPSQLFSWMQSRKLTIIKILLRLPSIGKEIKNKKLIYLESGDPSRREKLRSPTCGCGVPRAEALYVE
jgi:hypothetical protein